MERDIRIHPIAAYAAKTHARYSKWGSDATSDDIRIAAATVPRIERFLRLLGDEGAATRHPESDARANDNAPPNWAGGDRSSNTTLISWRRAGPGSTLPLKRGGDILGDTPSFFRCPDVKFLLPHLDVGGGASDSTPSFQVNAGDGAAPALLSGGPGAAFAPSIRRGAGAASTPAP